MIHVIHLLYVWHIKMLYEFNSYYLTYEIPEKVDGIYKWTIGWELENQSTKILSQVNGKWNLIY